MGIITIIGTIAPFVPSALKAMVPTTWFEVRLRVVNLLFSKKCREVARCMKCLTMHSAAKLTHAIVPQTLSCPSIRLNRL
jgi:hypothetical protein